MHDNRNVAPDLPLSSDREEFFGDSGVPAQGRRTV
jgi:hypothetical protein